MSFEIDRDSAGQADNVTSLDHEPGTNAAQRALAVLEDLFPDAALGLRRGREPHTEALIEEARAVVEMIKIASLGAAQEDMEPHAIYNASYLTSRILEVAIKSERGDYTSPKGASHE